MGSSVDHVYIVMEYVASDVKALMDNMRQRNKKFKMSWFLICQIQLCVNQF